MRRRGLLLGSAALLAGCDRITQNAKVRQTLARAENVTRVLQRLVTAPGALAREYTPADLSPAFKGNGTIDPDDDDYQDLAAGQFKDWRLEIGGMVQRPAKLSLDDLRALPARTQITRHDCVEGWSCIGKWKGTRLGPLLQQVGLQPGAAYIVFHCADKLEGSLSADKYYESIGLGDAFHPQTILAYEMNDQALPVRHGAPLRLRVERQLGYKMAKYIMRIEVVGSFAHIAGGKGGSWEDLGYTWYAGI
jgi:DMSO/TMAO reductase YedYZ molybdopterin-dependent catalytic subunit